MCIHKLDDLQLALVIARLYGSELEESVMPANMRRLLWEECLGCDQHGQNYNPASVHPDPFVRSMAYWMMKDYSAALGTLLETGVGARSPTKGGMEEYASNPSVFNFYNYLRTHPLLVRQHLAMTAADKSQTVLLSGFSHGTGVTAEAENNVTYIDCITPVERRLYFQTAHAHFKSGCPALALEVLSKLPEIIDTENDITKSRSADSVCSKSEISSGTLETRNQQASKPGEWGGSDKASTVESMDWSQPVSNQQGSSALDLDWSQPISASGGHTAAGLDWGTFSSKMEDDKLELNLDLDLDDDTDTKSDSEVESKDKLLKQGTSEEGPKVVGRSESGSGVGDIMAQQLKFIACLKIMMEELSTLATGTQCTLVWGQPGFSKFCSLVSSIVYSFVHMFSCMNHVATHLHLSESLHFTF